MHFWLFDTEIQYSRQFIQILTTLECPWSGRDHVVHVVQVSHPDPEVMHKGKAAHPNWNLDVHVMHSAIQLWYIHVSIDQKTSKQHIFNPYHLWCICYQSWFPMLYVPDPWLSQEPWQQPVETNNMALNCDSLIANVTKDWTLVTKFSELVTSWQIAAIAR